MQVSLAMQNCGLVTERRACHYQAICPAGLDFMEGRTMVAILTQSFCTCRLLSGKIDLNSKPRVRRVVRAASTSLEHFHEQESGIPAPQHETVQGACSSGRPGLEQPFHSSSVQCTEPNLLEIRGLFYSMVQVLAVCKSIGRLFCFQCNFQLREFWAGVRIPECVMTLSQHGTKFGRLALSEQRVTG